MAGLKTKPEYEGLAQAVSLGIALIKKTKQDSWTGLIEAMGRDDPAVVKAFKAVDLTDEQLLLIDEWQPVLNLVSVNPTAVPAVCPVCDYYVLTADTAPSRCMVTAGCEGKPFKVAAATAERQTPAWKRAEEAKAAEEALARKPANAVRRAAPGKRTTTEAGTDPLDGPDEAQAGWTEDEPDMPFEVTDADAVADPLDFPDDDFDAPVLVPDGVDPFE